MSKNYSHHWEFRIFPIENYLLTKSREGFSFSQVEFVVDVQVSSDSSGFSFLLLLFLEGRRWKGGIFRLKGEFCL